MDVTAYLNQGELWYSAEGTEVKIKDMTPNHAAMSAEWLTRNATGFILVMEAVTNEDALNGDAHVTDVLALMAQSPRQWMTSTVLYRALTERARRT